MCPILTITCCTILGKETNYDINIMPCDEFGIIVVLSGMSNLQQIKDNTSYMKEFVPLNQKEREVLERAVATMKQNKAIVCSQCGKCDTVCPKDIHISHILATYNTIMRQWEQGLDVNVELNYYRPLKRRQHGGDLCDNCGKCNKVCPMQLDVMSELKQASDFQDEHSFWQIDHLEEELYEYTGIKRKPKKTGQNKKDDRFFSRRG